MSYTAPDFRNTTAGVGSLYVGAQNVGILEKVNVKKGSETLDLRKGTPRQLLGRIPIARTHIITAEIYEGHMDNLGLFAGTDTVSTIAGSPVTITMGGAGSSVTFAAATGETLQSVKFMGTIASVVVRSADELTLYTVGTDYLVDAAYGRIYRNPSGGIGSLANVHVSLTRTPPASKQLNIGSASSITFQTLADVEFRHPCPTNSGKQRICHMWLAQCNGDLELNYEDEKFQITNIVIEAISTAANDAAHPTNPYGYWNWEE